MAVWTRLPARLTMLAIACAVAEFPAAVTQAQVAHVWECPAEVRSDLVGRFEILPRLVVGSGGAALATFTVEPLANIAGGAVVTDGRCATQQAAGESIGFHVMRELGDAALAGVVRLTLRVCSSGPSGTEWITDVTVLPPARPFRWIIPDYVPADRAGEFRFRAALEIGEGGAFDDFESAWGIENVLGGFFADGFCFPETFVAEGATLWLDVWGSLVDPSRDGSMQVRQGICSGMLGGGHVWESDVRVVHAVPAEFWSFSALKGRYSQH